jgi:RimJ/RimL family protein N-acetyltransferase
MHEHSQRREQMPLPEITLIESRRVRLRPVAETDLPALLEINGDPEVTRFLPYATWQSLADGSAWLRRMEALSGAGTGRQLVIERRTDSRVVGTFLLFRYEEPSGRAEVGYVLGRAHWRQGLMREALGAVCAHAFGSLGLRRLEAEADPLNVPSCRLLVDAGFQLEGRLRQRWVTKGVANDTNLYGFLVDDVRSAS